MHGHTIVKFSDLMSATEHKFIKKCKICVNSFHFINFNYILIDEIVF
jgi:hypothetical protein